MLKFDYSQAMGQVRELRLIAGDMEKNRLLSTAIEKVKASWEGQTSSEFQTKCGHLVSQIKKEITNIRGIADGLEKSANAIAEAERAAEAALENNTIRNT